MFRCRRLVLYRRYRGDYDPQGFLKLSPTAPRISSSPVANGSALWTLRTSSCPIPDVANCAVIAVPDAKVGRTAVADRGAIERRRCAQPQKDELLALLAEQARQVAGARRRSSILDAVAADGHRQGLQADAQQNSIAEGAVYDPGGSVWSRRQNGACHRWCDGNRANGRRGTLSPRAPGS